MKKRLLHFIIILFWGLIINTFQFSAQIKKVGNEPVLEQSVNIVTGENRLIITNTPVNSKIEIYNVLGTKIKEVKTNKSSGEYILNLPQGYYIVRVANIVRKVAIK